MARHTPGPWRWVAPGDLRNDEGDEVGDCLDTLDVSHPDPRCEADAHLIAAAPDLLAACEAAMPILRAYIHPDQFDGHAARALLLVRDALEKAKGGAP